MSCDRDLAVVIGDVNMDLSLCLDALPALGGDSRATDLTFGSGGAGLNAAVAFRALGADARLLGRVGRDAAASVALDVARARGVDLGQVQVDDRIASGCCTVLVTPDGHRSFLSFRGANVHFEVHPLEATLPSRTKVLFVSAYALLEGPQARAARAFIEARGPVPVLLDLGLLPAREGREAIRALLPHVALLTGNEHELSALFDGASDAHAVERALAAGARQVAVKRGAEGATLHGPTGVTHQAARPIVPVDTTACGDAFSAALGLLLARGAAPEHALALAVELGTQVARSRGAARSIPTEDELRRGLEPALRTLIAPNGAP